MAPKVLQIATLGFYANERVRHVSLRRKADEILLIYSPENKEHMNRILELYKQDSFPVESMCVSAWKYESILAELLGIIVDKQSEFETIEFNISCGTTAMRAACHMAAVLTNSLVHFMSEKNGEAVGDLETVQPLSVSQLTSPKKQVLKRLVEIGGTIESQRKLGSLLNLTAPSVSRHIKDLRRFGYISFTEENGKHMIQITDLGRVIIRLKEVKSRVRKKGSRS